MAVKAVNDTAGPDGLVPTLLVFGAYPRMSTLDPPAPTITQRATAVRKAMAEVAKIRAERQVNNALNQRNGPSVEAIHDLPLTQTFLYGEKAILVTAANRVAHSSLLVSNARHARGNFQVALLTSERQLSSLTYNLNLNQEIKKMKKSLPTRLLQRQKSQNCTRPTS
jgi:hypothetical protein